MLAVPDAVLAVPDTVPDTVLAVPDAVLAVPNTVLAVPESALAVAVPAELRILPISANPRVPIAKFFRPLFPFSHGSDF